MAMAASVPPETQGKPYTHKSEKYNTMFGTLFDLVEAGQEQVLQLAEDWYNIIEQWYPDLNKKMYCVPPVHFNKVCYSQIHNPELKNLGVSEYKPVPYSSMKNDMAQHRILWTLCKYTERKGSVAFILSNMEFQSYLNRDYKLPQGCTEYPKPDLRDPKEEGDIDVLVIDKNLGVFIFEVKSVGGDSDAAKKKFTNPSSQTQDVAEILREESIPTKKKNTPREQLTKAKNIMQKLLLDIDPHMEIKICLGYCFPNITREEFKDALKDVFQDLDCVKYFQAALCGNSKLSHRELINWISASTICKDDLPDCPLLKTTEMTDKVFKSMDSVWEKMQQACEKSKQGTLDKGQCYEKVVARFCGPLTTVKIYTEKSYPRVKVKTLPPKGKKQKEPKTVLTPETARTTAGAARVMARRFSEIVLLREQIDILEDDEDFVHLEGPPGTGKTIVLLLRVLTWLNKKNTMIWLLSLSPPSRSVTCVLYDQVKAMIEYFFDTEEAERKLNRLKKFIQTRPMWSLDDKYYERRLQKFKQRAEEAEMSKVCLVVDESGIDGKGLHSFFQQVKTSKQEGKDFVPGKMDFSVWSAAVEKVGRPKYISRQKDQKTADKFGILKKLKFPVRCPPTVQSTLRLVQPSLDQKNVCCFKKRTLVPFAASSAHPQKDHCQYIGQGIQTYLINHGNHEKASEAIWYCRDCGDDLGQHLRDTFKIGVEECTCTGKQKIFGEKTPDCPDCKKLPKGSLPEGDCTLRQVDTMIIATQQAVIDSVPLGGFVLALFEKNFRVAVNVSREDGDAPIPSEDSILITDLTSVHGLERAIIIIIPEAPVKPASDDTSSKSSQPTAKPTSDDTSSKTDQPDESDSSDDELELTSSDSKIQSALMSLGPKCRKDVFYIGSRAVCHMIVIHPGSNDQASQEAMDKDPARNEEAVNKDPARQEEAMDADPARNEEAMDTV